MIRLEIEPFDDKHLPAAATLLAARQRAHRLFVPDLPLQFQDERFNVSFLQKNLHVPDTDAVVALDDNRVVGFLLGRPKLVPPGSSSGFSWQPRSLLMPSDGHAVEPEFSCDIYSAMYAALSPRWVSSGFFSHYINLPAYDPSVLDTWFLLTFGVTWTYAIRDTGTPLRTPSDAGPDVETGLAESGEREEVLDLLDELYRYHSRPPCYLPFVSDTAAGFRADNEKSWTDPSTIHWVARNSRGIVGVLVVQVPGAEPTDLQIGKPEHCPFIHLACTAEANRGTGVGTHLVDSLLKWARQEGFSCCTVEWHTANLAAASFWEQCEFRPVRHMLFRHIDERIGWGYRE